jgi:hypothetical protein
MDAQQTSYPRRWGLVYGICLLIFLTAVACSFRPGYGFSSLDSFGDRFKQESLSGLGCYVARHSTGSDGQFYAKRALDPLLLHPFAKGEIDGTYYRGRRILLSWTAWMLGFGRPAWIIQVFALQNIACWLMLAWLLFKWFPPLDFNNYLRWSGVLFSTGMIDSVKFAFVDGPSLFFLALAVWFFEKKRNCRAGGILAIAGLARETNLLALFAILPPTGRTPRELAKTGLGIGLIISPLVLWLVYLKLHLPNPSEDLGTRNFEFPFSGYLNRWKELITALMAHKYHVIRFLLPLIALTTQAVFLCRNAVWRNPWWRMGAAYVLLMVFLGHVVWEGTPGAAPRVLLPMGLAFNLLVPRGRYSLGWLLLGNLWLFWPELPYNPPLP